MSAPWHADPFEPERYELTEAGRHRFEVTRRGFLEALGGGIAVLVLAPRVPADGTAVAAATQGPGVSAFVQIDARGNVAVFTGKAEVGQDIRTSLTQAVAEELRVAPASISLVMADTDRVPFDPGTFGSRTTPTMAPQLRRAAVATRAWLAELAAARLGVPVGEITVADGRVLHAGSGRALVFGDLTADASLTRTLDGSAALTPADAWRVCGTSLPKVHARALLTGAHRYPSDLARPGMLHGKVLRPAAFGAKLRTLDDSAAKAIPGVQVVRDGELVGVVAADADTATRALNALRATWDTAEPADEAMLWRHLQQPSREPARGGGRGGRGPATRGHIEAALAKAALRLEATYTIPYIAHAPLEPRAAVAEWVEGKLTVWTGTQRPFGVRDELARAFALAADKVRVIVPDTGSGYGGKHTGDAALEAAALARAAGRPVAVRWTREEEFTWAYFRPAGVIAVRAGVTAQGLLCGWEFHNHNSGGAALEPGYVVADAHCQFHPSDSPLRQGSYRALAATANHFARESHIDDLAALVEADPLTFRRNNIDDPRLRAVLDAAAAGIAFADPPPPGHARGLACGSDKGGYVATAAEVAVTGRDFRVTHLLTAFECGTVVHPDNLRSQVEGCVVQGLGGALYEAIHFQDGRITNPRFAHYRVPRFLDIPRLTTVLLDRPDLPSAGAGEAPIVAVAPAIRNALAAATGQRLRALPLRLD